MRDALVSMSLFGYLALFLAKPLWYFVPLAAARGRFAGFGPHWPPPEGSSWRAAKLWGGTRGEWMILVLCAVARAGLGWSFLLVRYAIGREHGDGVPWQPNEWNDAIYGWLAVMGFGFWLLVAKIAFRRAPTSKLAAFALIAEAMSLLVDIPLVRLSRFNIC